MVYLVQIRLLLFHSTEEEFLLEMDLAYAIDSQRSSWRILSTKVSFIVNADIDVAVILKHFCSFNHNNLCTVRGRKMLAYYG